MPKFTETELQIPCIKKIKLQTSCCLLLPLEGAYRLTAYCLYIKLHDNTVCGKLLTLF